MKSLTKETIIKSIEYSKYLPSLYSQFSVFTPYPGTPAYSQFKEIISDKESKYFTNEGFFRLSDIGYFDEDGYLFIGGRSDDVINVSGHRISSSEIESVSLSFNKIIDAFRMPKDNDENKNKRTDAIQEATKYAITVPFKIMETSYKSMSIIKKMAEIGNPNSITDAAVGALCARTSVLGAFLNVRINCKDCEDQKFVSKIIKQGNEIVTKTNQLEKEVLEITNSKI